MTASGTGDREFIQPIADGTRSLFLFSSRKIWMSLAPRMTSLSGSGAVHLERRVSPIPESVAVVIVVRDRDICDPAVKTYLTSNRSVCSEIFDWFPPEDRLWDHVAALVESGVHDLDYELDIDAAQQEDRFLNSTLLQNDEGPTPLVRSLSSASPFPSEALGPFQKATQAIAFATGAALGIVACSVIASANIATQSRYDVELPIANRPRVPTSLFFLPIADSGDRKTSSDKIAMLGVTDAISEMAQKHDVELQEWQFARDSWDADRKKILADRKLTGAERTSALRILGREPPRPLNPNIVIDDCTYEGIVRSFEVGQPAMGLLTSEGASLFGGHAMVEDAKMRTSAGLSKLWDGAELRRTRAEAGTAVFRARRLNISASLQPVIASKIFADPVLRGQGVLARFLVCQPASLIGTRTVSAAATERDSAISTHQARVRQMLKRPSPTRDGSHGRELALAILPLSNEAADAFIEFAQKIENECGANRRFYTIRDFAQKAPENAARLAATMHDYRGLESDISIDATDMCSAICLMQYFLAEALRLTSALQEHGPLYEAEIVRQWLIHNWGHDAISVRDLVQSGPNLTRNSGIVRRCIAILVEHGWLYPIDGATSIKGRRVKEAWHIVRSDDDVGCDSA